MPIDSPSRIRYVDTPNGRRRQARLLSLQGASNRLKDGAYGVDTYMYINVAIFLAWKHVQERLGSVIPSLPDVLNGCDLDWTLECRDTQFSPARGVRALVNATTEPTNATNTTTNLSTDEWQFPFAVVGAVYSSVSIPITLLGQGYALPQISATATSAALEHAPYFARTIPKNDAEALALMLYYKSIGVTHMACLYIKDPWGNYYATDIQNAAKPLGIQVLVLPYDDGNKASIRSALNQLKQSGIRHVYAIMFSWKPVIEEAIDVGVIGNPDYSWIGAEMIEWTAGNLEYNRSHPRDLQMANALRGVGSLLLDGGWNNSYHAAFESAMRGFANDRTLQEEYIQTYAPEDRHVFDNYTFEYVVDYFFQKAAYDATYSLAIAACQTPGRFTGPELYQTLVHLELEGVTGLVQFDNFTGTRKADSVMVRVDNVYWSDERSDEDFIRLDSRLAVTISQGDVERITSWRFYDNTTNIPPSIPPVAFDYNLIPLAAQIVGWALGGFVICLSLGLIGWTWYNRNLFVVKAGQPLFLSQLCVGTTIMAFAVIPMGMQGKQPSSSLNAACMTVPWLLFLGFVIAFSALFSKSWRLNQLMNSGMSMRRIQVRVKDVIWPFLVLMTINVAMLLGWSLVSPLQYVRVPATDVDSFGRTRQSHGQCKSPDNKYLYFFIPILLFDFLGLVTATYQSYKARTLPTTLSESSYLALAMASLLESLLLGGPILFMVMDNPTAAFLVGSSLLCITSMTILLPIFVPKYQNRDITEAGRAGSLVSTRNFRPSSRSNFDRDGSSSRMGSSSRLGHGSSRSMGLETTVCTDALSKPGLMYITRNVGDDAGSSRASTVGENKGSTSFRAGNSSIQTTTRTDSCFQGRASTLEPVLEA